MATTLSQGKSTLGSHPIILARDFAIESDRSKDSAVVNVLPVMPQVKGFRLLEIGRRP